MGSNPIEFQAKICNCLICDSLGNWMITPPFQKWVCCVNNSKCLNVTGAMFSKNLTFEETLETTAQINEELKREFDGAAFCKKKNHLISFIMFSLKVRRKSVEKIVHQSIGVTERPRSITAHFLT